MQIDRAGLEAWQRDQPLSILQLDPADRAVLRVAGLSYSSCQGSHHLKKLGFYEKLSQNGDPLPRLVFVKSLFRFFFAHF